MLHLAQVQKNPTTGDMTLQLLAAQTSDDVWVVGDAEAIALTPQYQTEIPYLSEGILVIVNLGESRQILGLENARDWLLLLLQRWQEEEKTEVFSLEEEEARIERWRQELTLQSQEIARRNLEIETRREQIQELEAALEKEKGELELRWKELNDN
ncbi:hypothetical protein [Oscillatoria sp. FACHB-1406]|uniref:hypothetical protein n=1 Tax=Oscillatoria sp. FACHB-1406 TaxID=2692846 RepID=UPI001682B03E|nr:hypothetical protein [Oscillatoria sp. FACHB-1406]MBD2578120.1 hypothetical protein [Oscillatoria sp. FACHB-1406]